MSIWRRRHRKSFKSKDELKRYHLRNFTPINAQRKYNHKKKISQEMLKSFSVSRLNKPTYAETQFESILHTLKLKFLEQPVCYKLKIIPDFVLEAPYFLVIEIDGEYHNEPGKASKDCYRDKQVALLGYRTIRFENKDVIENPQSVKNKLINILEQQKALNQFCRPKKVFFTGESRVIKPAKPIDSLDEAENIKNNS